VDYVVKPFVLAELDARIRAQLRAARQAPETTLRHDGITIDLLSRRTSVNGEPVRLTTTEFDLLAYLMRNPGRVLNRSQLLQAVWGYGEDASTNTVDVYIGYLRRKLGRPDAIATVRSRGYRLNGGA
jgi:two-component system response regulator MtrA